MSGPATAAGERIGRVVGAARSALAARAREIDDLNVFPVADGDTGGNMLATMDAVEDALARTEGMPPAGRAAAVSRAALMGARGNSGMILSQLVRGAAQSLGARGAAPDGPALTRALRAASDAAYAAVRAPVEGTMLTVARGAAEAAERAGAGEAGAALEAAIGGARDALARTPDLLAVLRAAGVVDSGGLAVVVLLEGLLAGLEGREPPGAAPAEGAPAPAADHPSSRFRYCTTFLVEGADIDAARLEEALGALGDSVLVMGDPERVKVHVHTDGPEAAAALAAGWGTVEGLRADDMRRQEAERAARLRRAAAAAPAARCGAIVVVEGDGLRALLEDLGAAVAAAGASASAAAPGAQEAVVVTIAPGRPGGAPGPVVETGAIPAALAAVVALDPDAGAAENADAMAAAAAAVACADLDAPDPASLRAALEEALAALLPGGPALVTLVVGAAAGVSAAEVEGWARAAAGPEVEVDAHEGGQPAPALAVGVE